eukprot:CAMPEP_0182582442 /NCGR_PEP_ID=MMETSP1324-20130603/52568_1 /TAXON_ID=236786 /ORGANISM="Florenciella sp., Strain RCC1587" /LENGTH=41 /DNA_ID= /DNA_START= /DNA_END= /DNA_ORIENTATION=
MSVMVPQVKVEDPNAGFTMDDDALMDDILGDLDLDDDLFAE